MAEFQVVMNQAKRMCEAHEACYKCPLKNHSAMCAGNKNLSCIASKCDVSNLESIVMDWAAANPEPRYPTWKEWHDTMFADSFVKEVPCPKFFLDQARGEILCAESEGCPDCWSNPIPADIAEKLHIKPIGVKDDA